MKQDMLIRLGILGIVVGGVTAVAAWKAGDWSAPRAGENGGTPVVQDGTPVQPGGGGNAGGSGGEASLGKTEFVYVVDPKPLSDKIEKGLKYLVNQQQANGGWGQGGGWRTSDGQGGRVEGKEVADPSDVGNTCMALLALIRAGNTPTEGPYAKNVAKGMEFLCAKAEAADKDSMYVTDVRNTQLQSKIGQFVDTFLLTNVFAELKGKMGDDRFDKRLVSAFDKTVAKIQKNQKADGHFAGNEGWASVLSQGLCSRGLNLAKQVGQNVDMRALKAEQKRAVESFDQVAGSFKSTSGGAGDVAGLGGAGYRVEGRLGAAGRPAASPAAPSDAGVAIYGNSANLQSLQQAVNANKEDERKAREIIANPKAPQEDKDRARDDIKRFEDTEKVQAAATKAVVQQLDRPEFIAGFGNNGGEEFLSFMNISESLIVKGGDEWKKWDKQITDNLNRVQDQDGSWSGHHCITGKTFCTAGALLVLMGDRTKVPAVAKASSK